MIEARWISRDLIEVPATARAPGVIGDGADLIRRGDPRWEAWASWLERRGYPRPKG